MTCDIRPSGNPVLCLYVCCLSFVPTCLLFLVFSLFFSPLLYLSVCPPCISLSLPPGYRMKAGQTAPQGKKRWGKIFLSLNRFFLCHLKKGWDSSLVHGHTECQIHHTNMRWKCSSLRMLDSVTPILLQRERLLNLDKQPKLCDCKRFEGQLCLIHLIIFFKHKSLFEKSC